MEVSYNDNFIGKNGEGVNETIRLTKMGSMVFMEFGGATQGCLKGGDLFVPDGTIPKEYMPLGNAIEPFVYYINESFKIEGGSIIINGFTQGSFSMQGFKTFPNCPNYIGWTGNVVVYTLLNT